MTGIEALRQLKAENENLKARLEGRTKHLNFYRQRLKFRRDQIAEISRQRDAEANRRFDLERELDALRDKISHMQEQGSTSHLKPKYDMALREIEDLKRQAHVRGTSQAYKAMKNRLEGTELEINSLKYQLERVNEVNDRGSTAFKDLKQYCTNIESANQEFVRRVDQKQEVIKTQSDTIMKLDARIDQLQRLGGSYVFKLERKVAELEKRPWKGKYGTIADNEDVIKHLEDRLIESINQPIMVVNPPVTATEIKYQNELYFKTLEIDELKKDGIAKRDRIVRQSRIIDDLRQRIANGRMMYGADFARPGGDKTVVWHGTRTGRFYGHTHDHRPDCSIRRSAERDMELEHERAFGLQNFMATVDMAKIEKQMMAYYSGLMFGCDLFKKPVDPSNMFAQFMNSLDK